MKYVLAAIWTFALLTAPAVAQSTGIIRGTVTDVTHNTAVAGASVRISSPAIDEIAVTDAHGRFTFWVVPPGPVHVGASADGFNSISFLVCSEAGVINDLQIRLLAGGGSTAMWMFGLNKDNDFRYNRLNPDITSDLYSVGSC